VKTYAKEADIMTTVKTILAGTVTAAALVLTGGLAYAATARGGPAAPAPAGGPGRAGRGAWLRQGCLLVEGGM
jgi:hypothetical protein